MSTAAIVTLVVFIFMVISLMLQKIPTCLTVSIGVIALWCGGALTMEETFANFVDQSIILVVAMMIVCAGLFKTNALINIANLVLKFSGKNGKTNERVLVAAAVIVTLLLSQFMMGLAPLLTVLPLLITLGKKANVSAARLVAPANTAFALGVSMFPVGLGITSFAMRNTMLENLGSTARLGIWDLCLGRVFAVGIALVYVIIIGYKLLPDTNSQEFLESEWNSDEALKESTLSRPKQILAYAIFSLTILSMLLSGVTGINMQMSAIVGALLMVTTGILNEKETFGAVHWPSIFLMGFILAFSTALNNSGAGNILSDILTKILGGNPSIYTICLVFFLVPCIATQFMDNVAIMNICIPLAVYASMGAGINPIAGLCAVELAALSSLATPMSSVVTAMSFSMGGYKPKHMILFSLPILLILCITSVVVLPLLFG